MGEIGTKGQFNGLCGSQNETNMEQVNENTTRGFIYIKDLEKEAGKICPKFIINRKGVQN